MADIKTPELRFGGFTNDWEQRKVSELCSISTGKSNTQDKVEDGEYPFYVRSPIIERSTKYLYDEEAVLTVGDGVGTGKVFHYVNGKYDLHQRCYRMYDFADELNAHYFYHTFSKLFYKRVMAMTAKTSVDSVRLEMITDMEIPCPDIREQEKIGKYFDNLDNLITLHQRKYDKLVNVKESMLEKMFPREGAKAPEIRFEGFTDDWEQRKVSDLFESVESGNRLPKTMICKGDIPYVVASNENNGIVDYISENQNDFHGNKMKLFAENSITFSIDNPEAIFVQKTPFFTSNIMRVLHNDKYNYYHIVCFRELIKSLTSYYNWSFKFSGPVVMNSDVFVPVKENGRIDLAEIERIGKVVSELDDLITLHRCKCKKLLELKKALLHKLFL